MQKLELGSTYDKAYLTSRCFKGLFTHDISNVFHSISSAFELCLILIQKEIENEDILEFFKLIEEQINRGKKLVKDFRKLTESESSAIPLEPLDLLKTLTNAIRFVQASFPFRKIEIKIDSEIKIVQIHANDLIFDAFENVLINSINYNENNLIQIVVSISEIMDFNREFIKLEFKDNGVGIEDTKKYEILQEGHKKTKESKGMGIGLSLVAILIHLYGGKVWIEDRIRGDPSKGSNFVILLPKVK
ncbi:MAG: sensor histidine kinase [Candidatus Thorarchaeota archaeon]